MTKVSYLFLTFLCFFLLCKFDCAYASAFKPAAGYSIPQNLLEKKQLNTGSNQNGIITDISFEDEKDYLNDVEDDESVAFARKYVLLNRYFFILQSICIINFLYRLVKGRLPVFKYFYYKASYKYIIQRSLRI
ncbi:MAG: hypothetical protein EOP42_16210 [Sphingobacteriaceae bacterium]|nr:MAG: hypothetical protein EOP42_16210 [Sphingobacteriaceae bacterium]